MIMQPVEQAIPRVHEKSGLRIETSGRTSSNMEGFILYDPGRIEVRTIRFVNALEREKTSAQMRQEGWRLLFPDAVTRVVGYRRVEQPQSRSFFSRYFR